LAHLELRMAPFAVSTGTSPKSEPWSQFGAAVAKVSKGSRHNHEIGFSNKADLSESNR
jgi:hypothetical protein